MNIVVTCRHASVGDAVRDYARQKAQRLSRHFDLIQSLEVVLSPGSDRHKVEIIAGVKRGPAMVAAEETRDMHEALDLAMAKLERQLIKQKEKLKLRRVKKPEAVEPREDVAEEAPEQ